jgi:hypothetical protein
MRSVFFARATWRRLARFAWLALSGLTLAPFIVGLPLYAFRLQTPCAGPACITGQLSQESSATFTLVYFGSVIVFQATLSLTSGQDTALASVASTLVLAALFRPLRARIQAGIDRRFYRLKYDAARVAAAFGARIRDEVDLQRSVEALVTVVSDTLAPSQVWLWLPDQRRKDA